MRSALEQNQSQFVCEDGEDDSSYMNTILVENLSFDFSTDTFKGFTIVPMQVPNVCLAPGIQIIEEFPSLLMSPFFYTGTLMISTRTTNINDLVNMYGSTKNVWVTRNDVTVQQIKITHGNGKGSTYCEITKREPSMKRNDNIWTSELKESGLYWGVVFDPGGIILLPIAEECRSTLKCHFEDKVVVNRGDNNVAETGLSFQEWVQLQGMLNTKKFGNISFRDNAPHCLKVLVAINGLYLLKASERVVESASSNNLVEANYAHALEKEIFLTNGQLVYHAIDGNQTDITAGYVVENGFPYWFIKSSWVEGLGVDYFKMLHGKKFCAISICASLEVLKQVVQEVEKYEDEITAIHTCIHYYQFAKLGSFLGMMVIAYNVDIIGDHVFAKPVHFYCFCSLLLLGTLPLSALPP